MNLTHSQIAGESHSGEVAPLTTMQADGGMVNTTRSETKWEIRKRGHGGKD